MKRATLIATLIMTFCLGMSAQKGTTTKPSVAQIVSIMDSQNPSTALAQLAIQNGYKKGVSGTQTSIQYEKQAGSNQLLFGMFLNNYGKPYQIHITTYTKAVADSWMQQITNLGYVFEGKSTEELQGGLFGEVSYSTETYWIYSKPTGYTIKVSKNSDWPEYKLTIER